MQSFAGVSLNRSTYLQTIPQQIVLTHLNQAQTKMLFCKKKGFLLPGTIWMHVGL
jgi:hypothetical protein